MVFLKLYNNGGTNLVFWIPDNAIMIKFDSNDVVELSRSPPSPHIYISI